MSGDLTQLVNCRDLNKQLGDAQHLQQLKLDAQAVIVDIEQQAEMQRALKKKLIHAKAELEVLLLDDKQACNLLYCTRRACSFSEPLAFLKCHVLILTCM